MEPEKKSLKNSQARYPRRPLVFLDTNVILGFLRGDLFARQVFEAEESGDVDFAVNPIVLQELLLASNLARHPAFEQIRDHWQVLPIDYDKAQELLKKLQSLTNRRGHSNDVLILSSADNCDFLVTSDKMLKMLVTSERPQVVTAEELISRLRAA